MVLVVLIHKAFPLAMLIPRIMLLHLLLSLLQAIQIPMALHLHPMPLLLLLFLLLVIQIPMALHPLLLSLLAILMLLPLLPFPLLDILLNNKDLPKVVVVTNGVAITNSTIGYVQGNPPPQGPPPGYPPQGIICSL